MFANHRDRRATIDVVNELNPSQLGVINSDTWNHLKTHMQWGMMFIDENNKISLINKMKLHAGNCLNLKDVISLSLLSPKKFGSVWHHEDSNCNGQGSDYSLVQLEGSQYSNFDTAGASLQQGPSVKFDKWPYGDNISSHELQNQLLYFIK